MYSTHFLFLVALAIISSTKAADDTTVIYNHLKAREGFCLVGYIPRPQSGVTIATGVDLGQHSKQELNSLGVPASVLNTIDKYLGLQTKKQVRAKGLDEKNLKLTAAEAESLDLPFLKKNMKDLKSYFGKLSVKGKAVLLSLRHWGGKLGNNGKPSRLTVRVKGKLVNYVWDVIKGNKATDAQLVTALKNTKAAPVNKPGTVGANRLRVEIKYLESSVPERIGCNHK